MSPDLIEQFHRMELKIDHILQHLRLKDEFLVPKINEQSICPVCEEVIGWKQNRDGEIVRDCGCNMILKSINLDQFTTPEKKNKGEK